MPLWKRKQAAMKTVSLPGEHSERVPPDPIPNSEVKPLSANDSVSILCESRTSPGFYS